MLLIREFRKITTSRGYLFTHIPNRPNPRKTNPTQKTSNTEHRRQSGKQTSQIAEKIVDQTVPGRDGNGALNAMRSTWRETKDNGKLREQRATTRKRDGREVERATRDAAETGQTRSRANSARRSRNRTDGKSSQKRAIH